MHTNKFVSFVMYVTLLIVLLGLVNMIFDLHRFAFAGEFLIFLVLLLLAGISAIGLNNGFSWAYKLLKVFFVLAFLDLLLVYSLSAPKPDMFFTILTASIAGFFISWFSLMGKNKQEEEPKEVKTSHKPGKYVGSKSGTVYHAPKCDWAKRIRKNNLVWFPGKSEAKKAGYKAHECV